jgi:hypothetical protein
LKINDRIASQDDTRRLGFLRKTCKKNCKRKILQKKKSDLEPIVINLEHSETGEDDSDVTSPGGRYDDDNYEDDDTTIAAPFD